MSRPIPAKPVTDAQYESVYKVPLRAAPQTTGWRAFGIVGRPKQLRSCLQLRNCESNVPEIPASCPIRFLDRNDSLRLSAGSLADIMAAKQRLLPNPRWIMAGLRLTAALVLAVAAAAATRTPPRKVTIIVEFQKLPAAQAVAAMEREVARIFSDTPLEFDWVSRQEGPSEFAGEVAVVRFAGECRFHSGEPERHPVVLAATHVSDGAVLPFSDVACDRIVPLLRPVIPAMQQDQADRLFGRAMGRVVAHELVHIFSRSTAHAREGVAEASLSATQLTTDVLALGPAPE